MTGTDDAGRSVIVSDGSVPRSHAFASIPGFANATVWSTPAGVSRGHATGDRTTDLSTLLPEPGGSTFFIVQFPPEANMAKIDPAAAGAEQAAHLPGLSETFDPERPGFHATPSVDYVILLSGELWLELEAGEPVRLRQGDVVIQNGTWHAWHNRTNAPAVIAAISLGVADAA
ncbi:cupin domain-containing protein [Sphingomonas fuzhouensis]|uniref:cupin domain-containing protein n=1 Tax=Sphingomonas fuzhouensis TaxID=3106033 RepID=UPI002B001099|nr:cupin domain-containing protein [Sphingomonas sp. SGZ-02]